MAIKLPRKLSRGGTVVPTPDTPPWWVRWFVQGGLPVTAVIVAIMCAPGEHHMATLAQWDNLLAWGMPSCLILYAGMSSIIATLRPWGERGKWSAVIGAVLAVSAALTAQGVSHAIKAGWLSVEPRVPLLLVLATSVVPPLVFGHLLHMAAGPNHLRKIVKDRVAKPERHLALVSDGQVSWDNGQSWLREGDTRPDTVPPVLSPETDDEVTDTWLERDAAHWTPDTSETPVPLDTGTPDTDDSETPDNVRPLNRVNGELSGTVCDLLRDTDLSDEEIITTVRDTHKDKYPRASIKKTINRYRDRLRPPVGQQTPDETGQEN